MIKPRNIVLAEDDADDRDLFLEAIAIVDPSIHVAMVENGEKLMSHLHHSPVSPDCIFLDLNMPKKNGKECLAEIRASKKIQMIPVFIYTTSLNSRDIEETFIRGASGFMRKPNSFAELTGLLDKCIACLQAKNAQQEKDNYVLNWR